MEVEDKDELQKFFGMWEIEQEIKVIPAQSGPAKLNFHIYEEVGTNNNTFDYSNKAFETDEADKYFHRQGIVPPEKTDEVYLDLDVLPFLYGKPWNNLALNLVMSLKPTAIRVINDSNGATCDAWAGRVTVWLENDGRTIESINQEAICGGIGVKCGEDLHYKMRGIKLPDPSDDPIVYYNSEVLKKISPL